LVCFAAWNGWNYWQQRQATQAAVLFDTFEEASKQGDLALLARSLSDLQDQFPRTTLTAQAALIAAKTYFDKEKFSEAEKPLEWVVDHASDKAYVALARLRLSALAVERKDMAKARSWVEGKSAPEGFQPLFDDRMGDIALIEGKHEEAKTRFTSAYKAMDESTEYRRLIEVKLGTLGVDIASPEFKK
jgi:predicted negative regulator of RcsB-dependent stress response